MPKMLDNWTRLTTPTVPAGTNANDYMDIIDDDTTEYDLDIIPAAPTWKQLEFPWGTKEQPDTTGTCDRSLCGGCCR